MRDIKKARIGAQHLKILLQNLFFVKRWKKTFFKKNEIKSSTLSVLGVCHVYVRICFYFIFIYFLIKFFLWQIIFSLIRTGSSIRSSVSVKENCFFSLCKDFFFKLRFSSSKQQQKKGLCNFLNYHISVTKKEDTINARMRDLSVWM